MINSTNTKKNSVGKKSIDKHFKNCILCIINQNGWLIFAEMFLPLFNLMRMQEKIKLFFSIHYLKSIYKSRDGNVNTLMKIRSSGRYMFCKKGVLRNFAKFTGKHLCQSLIFNKAGGLEFCEFFKNTFSTEHLQTTASVVSFISFFIKARILLQFLSLVFINALITSIEEKNPYK